MKMKNKIPVSPEKGLSRLCLLAACAPSAPQVSADPVLASMLASFGTVSIGNAPTFTEAGTGAAFSAYPPQLAPGMDYIASGEPGRSCSVTVKRLWQGQADASGERHQPARTDPSCPLGGTFSAKKLTGDGGAKVRANGHIYCVFGYVAPTGNLSLGVS
jgi:hypothetical protein